MSLDTLDLELQQEKVADSLKGLVKVNRVGSKQDYITFKAKRIDSERDLNLIVELLANLSYEYGGVRLNYEKSAPYCYHLLEDNSTISDFSRKKAAYFLNRTEGNNDEFFLLVKNIPGVLFDILSMNYGRS